MAKRAEKEAALEEHEQSEQAEQVVEESPEMRALREGGEELSQCAGEVAAAMGITLPEEENAQGVSDEVVSNTVVEPSSGESGQGEAVAAESGKQQRKKLSQEEVNKLRAERRQRQKEMGRRMLEQKRAGISSVMRVVKINNGSFAPIFMRNFPVVNICAYALENYGNFAIGGSMAEKLLKKLETMVEKLHANRQSSLHAVQALSEECYSKKEHDFVPVSYVQPALEKEVQLRSPLSIKALEAFVHADATLTELETLHWNGERSKSDITNELHYMQREIDRLGVFAASTVAVIDRVYKMRVEGVPQDKINKAVTTIKQRFNDMLAETAAG